MAGATLTVTTSRYEPSADHMVRLARSIADDNPGLDLAVVDVDDDPMAAVELGVMTCPALVVEAHGHAPVKLEGLRSRRAVLHALLPLLHDEETALAELRRQTGSPNEHFPRLTRRRVARVGQKLRVDLLASVPLFSGLSKRQLKHLAAASHEVVVDEPTTVIRQGEPGDEFFVVADGEVEVTRDRSHAGTIGPGGYFGELSLLDDEPRSATVTTNGPATFLAIDRPTFRAALASSPDMALALLGHLAHLVRER